MNKLEGFVMAIVAQLQLIMSRIIRIRGSSPGQQDISPESEQSGEFN